MNNQSQPVSNIDLLQRVEASTGAEAVLYSGPIDDYGFGELIKASLDIPPQRRILLILTTYGGLANSAYRIARFCQDYFEGLDIFIPGLCKSAGTLVALGADRVFMSPFGELGPLDVQLFKSDELFQRRSGLLSKSALLSLSEHAFEIFEQFLMQIKRKGYRRPSKARRRCGCEKNAEKMLAPPQ